MRPRDKAHRNLRREADRGRLHWKALAVLLHELEPKFRGDWYEICDFFGFAYLTIARDFDMNEFRRICASGELE